MIEKILIISLATIGYCCTFWPDMIFEKIGDWMEEHFPEWFNKPTWNCYICCVPWFGSAIYWLLMPHCTKYISWDGNIFEWLLTVIPAMGLNAIISELTKKKEPEPPLIELEECKICEPEIKITIKQ